jgi:hypothetical protein
MVVLSLIKVPDSSASVWFCKLSTRKSKLVRVHNFIALIIGRKIDACPVGKPQNGAFASFETVSLVDGYCIILERLGNKQLEKG